MLLFALQMAEIFRRVQWFMIRVEWELCTKASSSVPVVLKTRFTVTSPRPSQVCIEFLAFPFRAADTLMQEIKGAL
jgi:hypothetical protein